ncbi:MAG TPA: tyrosine-type recombinase/integrase [Planctomycetota bacterium]|jgi:hypothetical protein
MEFVEKVGRCRIYCRNGHFYLRWYEPRANTSIAGVRCGQVGDQPKEGPFDNLIQARQYAERIDRSLAEGQTGDVGYRTTVARAVKTLVEQYHNDPACSPKTATAYASRWSHFVTFCGTKCRRFTFAQITPAIVAEFERWLNELMISPNGHENAEKRRMHPSYQRHVMESASMLYNKAVSHGWVSAAKGNPFRFRSQGRRRNPQQFPGFDKCEVDKALLRDFIAACDPFQHRLFLLMLSCGVRTDEVRHMLIEKIDWPRRVYVLDPVVGQLGWNTKNGKYRLLPILRPAERLFRELQEDRRGILVLDRPALVAERSVLFPEEQSMHDLGFEYGFNVYQFRNAHNREPTPTDQERMCEEVFLAAGALHRKRVYKEFQKVVSRIGAERHLWPHLTRHVAASQAHQLGVDRFVALSVLGHSGDKVFDGYCEKSPEFMHREWAKVVGDNTVIADALAHFNAQPPKLMLPGVPQPQQIA